MKTRLEEIDEQILANRNELWKLAGWSETWTKLVDAVNCRIKLEVEKALIHNKE